MCVCVCACVCDKVVYAQLGVSVALVYSVIVNVVKNCKVIPVPVRKSTS